MVFSLYVDMTLITKLSSLIRMIEEVFLIIFFICVMGWAWLKTKCKGTLLYNTNSLWGTQCAKHHSYVVVCMDSPVIITSKDVNKQKLRILSFIRDQKSLSNKRSTLFSSWKTKYCDSPSACYTVLHVQMKSSTWNILQ